MVSAQTQKLLMGLGFALGLGISVALMKDRRSRDKSNVKMKSKFHARRNTSQGSLQTLQGQGNAPPRVSYSRTASIPNEGPNVGFVPGPTWTDPRSRDVVPVATDRHGREEPKLVIIMLGFPGSGKTNIASKVARFLRWNSHRCRVFSIAKYRLDKVGTKSADFFDPANEEFAMQRHEILKCVVQDAIRYMQRGGQVVVIDGTNTTRGRRDTIREMFHKEEEDYRLLFIETKGKHESNQITAGHASKSRMSRAISSATLDDLQTSPDFNDEEDHRKRLAYYEKNYQSLGDEEGSSITVLGSEKRLILHAIHGFIPTKIVSFVMNLHKHPRVIYLCRHGESEFNVRGLIGGDSQLSARGEEFAGALASHMATIYPDGKSPTEGDLTVWTSTMNRARQTACEVKATNYIEWRLLRDLEVGTCDGLSYKQIQVMYPEEFRTREQDKLRYRYPRGESYLDLINRLEPAIFELERQRKPVLIVAHQAVLRCLYGYFLDLPESMLPHVSIPLHTIIRLEPGAIGCAEKRLRFVLSGDTEADTARNRSASSWESYQMSP